MQVKWCVKFIKFLLILVVIVGISSIIGAGFGFYFGKQIGAESVCKDLSYYYVDHLPLRGCNEAPISETPSTLSDFKPKPKRKKVEDKTPIIEESQPE